MNRPPVGVKGIARPQPAAAPQNRLPFQFRADPVALDQLGLSRTARAVFVAIMDDAKSKGWKSRRCNATLARILKCSTMTIKRALAALEALGLVRREYTIDGRIRLGIHVTWDGVEQSRSTEQASVEHSCSTGGTPVFRGVEQECSTSSESGIQIERDQTGPIFLSTEEDEEQAVLFTTLGPAAYLRMMMEKGRQEAEAARAPQQQKQQPAAPSPAPPAVVAEAPSRLSASSQPPAGTPKPSQPIQPTPPPKSPTLPQDDARRTIGRWVGNLFKDARMAAWGPAPGKPRHPTQAEQLAALAERKRRREREARNGPGASNRPPNNPNISTP